MKAGRPRGALLQRLATTLLAAATGAVLGNFYAAATLAPAVLARKNIPGMYATAGALIAVLGMRLIGVLLIVWREFRPAARKPEEPPSAPDQRDF